MSKVLIVEDDPVSAQVLEGLLLKSGLVSEVIHATNGLEALHQLAELSYQVDLLITDIVMPQMDGMTLAYELYQIGMIDHIPLIGASSLSVNDLVAIQNSSADVSWFSDWLSKPFTQDAVITLLSDHL